MKYFRYYANATQVVGTDTVVTYPTVIADADSVVAGSVFTVPAGWTSLLCEITAGIRLSAAIDVGFTLRIEKSTDGGSNWTPLDHGSAKELISGNGAQSVTVTSGMVLLSTGDKYRVVYNGGAGTKAAADPCFFAAIAYELGDLFGGFRAYQGTNQLLNGITFAAVANLSVEAFDTHNGFSGSQYTVPATFNGGVIDATMGLLTNGSKPAIYLQWSGDGGTNWTTIGQSIHYNGGSADYHCNCRTGPYPVSTGDLIRAAVYNAGTFQISLKNDPMTFLAGALFAP